MNRGGEPAEFDLTQITTEHGTTAELSDMAQAIKARQENMVPGKGRVEMQVGDLLTFTGPKRRASATLVVNANKGNIQVATTLINRDGGLKP